MVLQAIDYQPGSLRILNQLILPHRIHYEIVATAADAWTAIHSMLVRGAPAIAIVAALGLAVEVTNLQQLPKDAQAAKDYVFERLEYLVTSRPTAVNLGGAAIALKRTVQNATGQSDATSKSVIAAYVQAAEQMLVDDVSDNMAIGDHGADWIWKSAARSQGDKISIVTHCNTGSLATAGYGTALGVIRSLRKKEHLHRAFCTETRPYNQGSRLTAFELVHDEIPATLITDSMAAALLRLKGESERIAAIVVGADRVAANGDTANKIGTYALSILARHHGVKFIVAAPRTTIDMNAPSGDFIKIEERPGPEMLTVRGPKVHEGKILVDEPPETIRIAAAGIDVWNPAFDVTPCDLIDAIATEVGVVERNAEGRFDLSHIMLHGRSKENGVNGTS